MSLKIIKWRFILLIFRIYLAQHRKRLSHFNYYVLQANLKLIKDHQCETYILRKSLAVNNLASRRFQPKSGIYKPSIIHLS